MTKSKLIIENSNLLWDSKRRYRVNAVVTYSGYNWQNLTGNNSEPGVGTDWQQTSFNEELRAMDSKDWLLTVATIDFEIPLGKTAKFAYVNQAPWFPVTPNKTTKSYTFSQLGQIVSFKTSQPINSIITIFFQ